jgi:hypothetical protein
MRSSGWAKLVDAMLQRSKPQSNQGTMERGGLNCIGDFISAATLRQLL